MNKADLIAFASRDWAAVEASKRERWSAQKATMSAVDALRIGDHLRAHMQSLHPGWPTDEDRRHDLAMHLRVSECLRRVQR